MTHSLLCAPSRSSFFLPLCNFASLSVLRANNTHNVHPWATPHSWCHVWVLTKIFSPWGLKSKQSLNKMSTDRETKQKNKAEEKQNAFKIGWHQRACGWPGNKRHGEIFIKHIGWSDTAEGKACKDEGITSWCWNRAVSQWFNYLISLHRWCALQLWGGTCLAQWHHVCVKAEVWEIYHSLGISLHGVADVKWHQNVV